MIHDASVWPSGQEYLRPLICTGYLVVLALLAVLFSKRLGALEHFSRIRVIPLLVAILLGASVLFILISALLLFGVGTSKTEAACSTAMWLCIVLYAGTKATLYALLLEKLYVVHCNGGAGKTPRLGSWWYRGGVLLYIFWITVASLMVLGRIAYIRDSGACVIGLKAFATGPMLAIDATTNIYLTSGFVFPIARSNFPRAQHLARISAIAAVAALITSFANILMLTLQHGHQLAFVCLGSCGLDVAFNSCAVFLVTSTSRDRNEANPTVYDLCSHGCTTAKPRASMTLSRRDRRGGSGGGSRGGGSGGGARQTASTSIGVTVTQEVYIAEEADEEESYLEGVEIREREGGRGGELPKSPRGEMAVQLVGGVGGGGGTGRRLELWEEEEEKEDEEKGVGRRR